MNILVVIFLLVDAALLLFLPRRWAPLPFLMGACYIPSASVLEFGPMHFTTMRILIAAGFVRMFLRGEGPTNGANSLDRLMLAWAVWAAASSLFHAVPSEALVFRLGMIYDACGVYFLLRIFCRSMDDVVDLCRATAIMLLPVAAEMAYEKATAHNLFSLLGALDPNSYIRDGKVRANGPFAHAILGGTMGAVCLPLMAGLWERHRRSAAAGGAACLIMIVASTSSGPIMSALFAAGGLALWRRRMHLRAFRWLAVCAYIGLDLVMKDPAYFIIARIDLTGSSTGWHRARLIQSSIEHLSEWWLAGTDYTRHWMPTGVSWSPNHTDITNQYLEMGVVGGLPLMFLFIAFLATGFSFLGRRLRASGDPAEQFMVWALGASLFAHATTFISVSYFDQSFVFIYLTLAAIGSVRVPAAARSRAAVPGAPDRRMPRAGAYRERIP